MSWPIKFGPTDLAAAQRIEQRRQAVMIDFLHQPSNWPMSPGGKPTRANQLR